MFIDPLDLRIFNREVLSGLDSFDFSFDDVNFLSIDDFPLSSDASSSVSSLSVDSYSSCCA